MKKQTYPLYFVSTVYLKHLLFLIVFSLIAVVATQAQQQQDSIKSPFAEGSRFYTGAELSTISYVMGHRLKAVGGITPIVHANFGYRLSRRMNVQVGLAYGGTDENHESIYYKTEDTTLYMKDSWSSSGLAVPLTVQFTPFNPNRKFQLYATASLIPVIGEVNQQHSETFEGETKITFNAHDKGMNLLATAGLVLNYRFSKRFEGYGKANLLYKEVGRYNLYAERTKSIAIGINYNL